MTPEKCKLVLIRHLDHELYQHSLGVAGVAADLAVRYGADVSKAFLAGLLHDYGKGYPLGRLRQEARRLELALDRITLAEPKLLHAPVGAALLSEELGIFDPAVIKAVAYHTTGRSRMSLLEKVVYLADFIEPGRDFTGVEQIRQLARVQLNAALVAAVEHTIRSVLERGMLLHPRTIQFRNSLLNGPQKIGG